ncbi:hypothetical protein [Streptomyces europaeiscabiei]|uniref:hypothetical protein n=1 Tax=Streptomyces europaeiscabiei TaxID=146819 RepID=UPI0038F66730
MRQQVGNNAGFDAVISAAARRASSRATWSGVVEEGSDRREGLGVVRGPEDPDRGPEKFGFHRRHGSRQRFDEVKGQAVVVERLTDRVQI